MAREPFGGHLRNLLERASFFKKVGGAGDEPQFLWTAQLGGGLPVEFDDLGVAVAHNQQRGGFDARQRRAGKVGPAAA